MPCVGLRGLDYIDEVVQTYYAGSWSDALQAFVEDEANVWCPTWMRKNYRVLNEDLKAGTADSDAAPRPRVEVDARAPEDPEAQRLLRQDAPKVKVVFEDNGEPRQDKEEQAVTTLDAWDKVRAPWERRSELGQICDRWVVLVIPRRGSRR